MGKRCAVKIMQLPATGLLSPSVAAGQDGQQQEQQQQQRSNSLPDMGIMEAVVSSTMSVSCFSRRGGVLHWTGAALGSRLTRRLGT
jgi:hypothetical protein